jgi:hypothetical protein
VDAAYTTPATGAKWVVELRQVMLKRPQAFRTTITESLLVYASTGSVDVSSGTPETLIRARRILQRTPTLRWSAIIAAAVAGGLP